MNGEKCSDLTCSKAHPPSRFICKFEGACFRVECRGVHPPARAQICESGSICDVYHCWGLHPPDRAVPCKRGLGCIYNDCIYLHPVGRVTYETIKIIDEKALEDENTALFIELNLILKLQSISLERHMLPPSLQSSHLIPPLRFLHQSQKQKSVVHALMLSILLTIKFRSAEISMRFVKSVL